MNLQLIKQRVEQSQYPGGLKALAEAVGMTVRNLHRCVRENKIQAQDLEKIASELKVPIVEFFEEQVMQVRQAGYHYVEKGKIEHKGPEYIGISATEADLRDQIAQLKSQLADKERIIKLMEK